MSHPSSVRCEFDACEISIVARVVTAAVDQLSAEEDVDIVVLEALEYPLVEIIDALHDHGIEFVDITTHRKALTLRIGLATPVLDVHQAFDESGEVIEAFFELHTENEPTEIQLTGSLV